MLSLVYASSLLQISFKVGHIRLKKSPLPPETKKKKRIVINLFEETRRERKLTFLSQFLSEANR